MTDNTKPEAMDLADWLEAVGGGPSAKRCAALLREQHTRIAELEAAPEAIAKLRHLYQNMVNGAVRDTASAKRIAEGLLAPAIEALERATPPAEQQAAPKAAPEKACVCGEPQAPGTVHRVDGPCYVVAPKAAPGDVLDEALRERDDAEDFIDALLDEVLGHERPEWSSSYGRADALNDVQERMTALHKPAVDKAWGRFQSAMAAPQQEAQEPSHRETVDVVGVRSNGEHVNLGKIAMPPRMKAREIAIEHFGRFKDDDGSDAEMCFGSLEYFLEWLIQQGWSKAPQPAPAPLSDVSALIAEARENKIRARAFEADADRWRLVETASSDVTLRLHNLRPDQRAQYIDAALAAQGGKV